MRFIIVIMAMILLFVLSLYQEDATVPKKEIRKDVTIPREDITVPKEVVRFFIVEKHVIHRDEVAGKYSKHSETTIVLNTGQILTLRGECLLPQSPKLFSLIFSQWDCPHCLNADRWY